MDTGAKVVIIFLLVIAITIGVLVGKRTHEPNGKVESYRIHFDGGQDPRPVIIGITSLVDFKLPVPHLSKEEAERIVSELNEGKEQER